MREATVFTTYIMALRKGMKKIKEKETYTLIHESILLMCAIKWPFHCLLSERICGWLFDECSAKNDDDMKNGHAQVSLASDG